MSIKSRKTRFEKARGRKTIWETTYRDAMRYASPQREMFNEFSKGDEKTNSNIVFDSTAQTAKDDFASKLEEALVPAYKKWTSLEAGINIPEADIKETAIQLEQIRNVMFNYIHNSNFNIQVSESLQDLAIGTGALLVNEGDDEDPIQNYSVPLNQLYLEEGPDGSVKTVFRKYVMPVRNLSATWQDLTLSAELEKMIREKPDKECSILESTIYDHATKTYEYSVDIDDKHNIYKEVMESSPWVIFRYSVLPGEVWGRGPVLKALPDIKTLNKAKELLLKSAALKMQPMFVVGDDGVINPHNIQIKPGGIIPAAPFGPGGNPISALPVGGDLNLGQFIIGDMREDIKKTMYADDLPDAGGAIRSPTELLIRQEKLASRIGAAFNRLQFELNNAYVKRVLYILNKKGLLPVDLTDVKVDGKVISIRNESPLAKAQAEEEIASNRRYIDEMLSLVGQEALPIYANVEGYAEFLAGKLDVDEKLKPTDEQRKRAIEVLQQIAASQQPQDGAEQQPQQQGIQNG